MRGGGVDEARGQGQVAARHQDDLAALGHVVQKLLGERRGQTVVLGDEVELVIAQQARDVEVARSHACPLVITDEGFGVNHGAAILEDPRARVQQLAISAPGEDANDGDVGRAGEQQPDIHAALGRVHEGREERGWRDEIRVGNPEPLRHRRREQLHRAIDT